MKLSNNWFTTVSETENGAMVIVCGRDDLELYVRSGKFKERVEIYWKYNGDSRGMPCESDARVMEPVQDALQKAMEKDKLAIFGIRHFIRVHPEAVNRNFPGRNGHSPQRIGFFRTDFQ